ncbi:hypothetical protein FRX31_035509 [Thalictrum thalictroides]|uniref:Uncharacterized protein n=1 Tax=Thalictrum thalictroides TaxID=46969 RepID=A0A7J6UQQ2_THATH|nr:hypothetical protein FRX31_035509 [Thalictrum thalictroides]
MNPIILEDMPNNSKPQPYHNSTIVAQHDCQNDFNDNDVCTFSNHVESLCMLPSVVGSSIVNPIILKDMPDNSKPQPYHNSTTATQEDSQNAFNDNDFCTFGNLEPLFVPPSVIWDDDVGLMQDYSLMEYKETIADDDYVTKPTNDYKVQTTSCFLCFNSI